MVRTSVQQALVASADDIGGALDEFGWGELVETDDTFAYTVLFEEQGSLGADTDALDVVTLAALGVTEPARVLWPLDVATEGRVLDGITLGEVAGHRLVVPAGESLEVIADATVDKEPAGGLAA